MQTRKAAKIVIGFSIFLILAWFLTFAFQDRMSELEFHTLFLIEGIVTLFFLPAVIYFLVGFAIKRRKSGENPDNKVKES